MGIIMPATWTAATLSFQVCDTDGGTFADLYTEAGAEVAPSSTPTQGKAYSLNTAQPYLAPWRWVKVRSGLTGAPQAQGADRVVTFVFQR
jgi:hypothetical protein